MANCVSVMTKYCLCIMSPSRAMAGEHVLSEMGRPVSDVVQSHCSRSFPSTVPCNNSMEMLFERL